MYYHGRKSVCIHGICVLSFFDGSVLLRMVVAWGLRKHRGIYNHIVIKIWHRMDVQPQRAPRAQSGGGYLSVLCALCGFCADGCIGFLWSAETVKICAASLLATNEDNCYKITIELQQAFHSWISS
jgi:hypothetical protein